MKYEPKDVRNLLDGVKVTDDVSGHCPAAQSLTSSGFVPIFISFQWYWQEDQKRWPRHEDAPPAGQVYDDICAC